MKSSNKYRIMEWRRPDGETAYYIEKNYMFGYKRMPGHGHTDYYPSKEAALEKVNKLMGCRIEQVWP
jgi:hypothetical protein